MDLSLIPTVREVYSKGENIIEFLRNAHGRHSNSLEDIIISYDFQSGSYIKWAEENVTFHNAYTDKIVDVLSNLGLFNSIIEVGVGEATTLGNVLAKLNNEHVTAFGFDISWSRIYYAFKYLSSLEVNAKLFVADLFSIPLGDSSIDIFYTSHALEPNGGREKEAIKELYRVAKKYLVLLEPTNEFADDHGKARMKKHGYVHNMATVIKDLGYELIEYRRFEVIANPLNPTGLYIIKKQHYEQELNNDYNFYCPLSKNILKEYPDHLFSDKSLVSYPKILGIPCLWANYGVLTSKHE
jgi:ubiquinone/menaquinone biosynthesis C-methylase UbiE